MAHPSPANMPKKRLPPDARAQKPNRLNSEIRPEGLLEANAGNPPQVASHVYSKPPLSLELLADRLAERGMEIPDRDRALRYLRHIGYFRLSAYVRPFRIEAEGDQLRAGTAFDDVLDLYVFDRKLRLLTLDALERIEVAVRAALIDYMATAHDDPHWYLQKEHFKDHEAHQGLIEIVEEKVAAERKALNRQQQQSRSTAVEDNVSSHPNKTPDSIVYRNALEHYIAEYQEPRLPPFWLVADALTLSQIESVISNLKQRRDKTEIARALGLNEGLMKSWMRSFNRVRNVCAHHSRLWNIEVRVMPSAPRVKTVPWLADRAQIDEFRQRRIYPVMVSIQSVLTVISPQSTWAKRLAELLSTRDARVLRGMGFPDDWARDPFWDDRI